MKTVLQDILQELKGQKEQLLGLQNELRTLHENNTGVEEKRSKPDAAPSVLSQEQMTLLRDLMAENFELLKAELKKHPAINTTHKHFALLPLNFRMEQFPSLVNTVMKWVVVLMVVVFTMRQISNLVNKSQHSLPADQKASVVRQ